MPRTEYTFEQTDTMADFDAGRIHSYLADHGVAVAGVSVSPKLREINIAIADDMSRAAIGDILAGYVPAETPAEQFDREAVEDAQIEVGKIAAKPRQGRTPTERILLGLSVDPQAVRTGVPNGNKPLR